MEVHLAEAIDYVEHSNTIEPVLHREQEKEFHLEIPEEPIDESVIDRRKQRKLSLKLLIIQIIQIPTLLPKNPSLQRRSLTALMRTVKQILDSSSSSSNPSTIR